MAKESKKPKPVVDMEVTKPEDGRQAALFIVNGLLFFIVEKPMKTLGVTVVIIGLLALLGSMLGLDQYTKVKVKEITQASSARPISQMQSNPLYQFAVLGDPPPNIVTVKGKQFKIDTNYKIWKLADSDELLIVTASDGGAWITDFPQGNILKKGK